MLKKWNKIIKLLATTVLVLIYVTTGHFRQETLKEDEDESNKKPSSSSFEAVVTTERYSATLKTIVGYSREFALRREIEGRIECESGHRPEVHEETRRFSWKQDEKLKLQIYSAYYDQRQHPYNYLRVIGLVPRNSSFYCQIWYQKVYITQQAVIREVWSHEWGPKQNYSEELFPAIISCLAPLHNKSPPSWVSFVDASCQGSNTFIRVTKPPIKKLRKHNFIICVKPSNFTNTNNRTLNEWIDINQRLGASKIVMYVLNSTSSTWQNQLLEKKEFPIPESECSASRTFEESIWYKRKMEIIAYNDCFYSNLYHTKFVIPLDVDEIIVPKSGNNWFETFRSHFINAKLQKGTKNDWPEDVENYASFSVRNAYFFSRYPKEAIIRSSMLPNSHQILPHKLVSGFLRKKSRLLEENAFDRTIRSYRLSPRSDSVKSFIHVPNTLSVFNHYAFHVLGNATRQYIFPPEVIQLNHYRNDCDPVLIENCHDFLSLVVHDDSLQRFRNTS